MEESYWEYEGPSLQMAYEHLKQATTNQMSQAGLIDTKASAIFAIATLMMAVVIPGVMTRLTHLDESIAEWVLFFSAISFALYLIILVVFVLAFRLQYFKDLSDPEVIKQIIKLNESPALISLYKGIEESYRDNLNVIDRKSGWLELLFYLALIETVLVLFLTFASAFALG